MTGVEGLLRQDRWIVIIGLLLIVILSVLYTVFGVGMQMSAIEMTNSKSMPMMMPAQWTSGYFILVFFMWWVMMIAMMVPSASPTVLLYTALNRQMKDGKDVALKAALFLLGYLVVWAGFSFLATLLQWVLEFRSLASPVTMMVTSQYLGAGILLAAGIYQFTPLKRACLNHCREPVRYLTERRRVGRGGAFLMGAEHGVFCLGCCWFLMALLFFGGIMNLYWIAGLAVFVLFEKLVPQGHWVGYGGGLALIGTGGYILNYNFSSMG
ncbi:MAG: hypothetical protein COB49_00975 [Alphaproteobacteria bacterium]|nr:MAG: hypothetical protein COB49_00975 [Alphaproteobacteria bacterium]